MTQYDYDLAVIGGGSAGSTAAKFATMQNRKVALIERDKLGGTCLNYGCDPTKALLHAAQELLCRRESQTLDIKHELEEKEWRNAMERIRRLIDSIRGGSHGDAVERQQGRGIDVFLADAAFQDEHTISLEDKSITADKILIATGMHPFVPPIDGLESTGYITNVQAVSLESLPSSLAIIGAGFIGVEFSQIFRRFGVEVTVLEMAPRIIRPADGEVSDQLRKYLEEEGIAFKLDAEIRKVSKNGPRKKITFKCDDDEHDIEVEEILVAAGRRPATRNLQLDNAGVEHDNGIIRVSEILQSSQPHIFAAGDVSGYPPFTHVAAPQGKLAVFNAFCQNPIPFDGSAIPAAAFTQPSIAYVGKTEEALREEGVDYRTKTVDIDRIPRNMISGEEVGLIKIITDGEGGILGAHIFAPRADEFIGPAVLAMRENLSIEQLGNIILPYPTRSQGLAIAARRFSTEMQDRCPDFSD